MSLIFRTCTLDDLGAVIELNRKNYGDEFFVSKEYFKWRFFSVEYEKSFLLGAFDDSCLVGVTGMFIAPYMIDGICKYVAVTFSSLIDKTFRTTLLRENGKLVTLYSKLVNESEVLAKERGCCAVIGFPNRQSYPTFVEKFGFKKLTDIDFYILPLDISQILRLRLHIPSMVANFVNGLIKRILHFSRRTQKRSLFYTVEGAPDVTLKFSPNVDLYCKRDETFLKWRFAASPMNYFTTICSDSQRVFGYCCWTISEIIDRNRKETYTCVKIADLYISPEVENAVEVCSTVLSEAIERGRNRSASFLVLGCKVGIRDSDTISKVVPFHINKIKIIKKNMPLIFKWIGSEPEPELNSFHITMSDNDVV